MRVLILVGMLLLPLSVLAQGKSYFNCEYPENQNEVLALSCNLYHEARGESLAGKLAVGFVTMNRVYSKRFPDTVNGVVYQKSQFSWFADGTSDKVYDLKEWLICMHLATNIINTKREDYYYMDITEGSLFYHSNKVVPYWVDIKSLVVVIDNHKFYTVDRKK